MICIILLMMMFFQDMLASDHVLQKDMHMRKDMRIYWPDLDKWARIEDYTTPILDENDMLQFEFVGKEIMRHAVSFCMEVDVYVLATMKTFKSLVFPEEMTFKTGHWAFTDAKDGPIEVDKGFSVAQLETIFSRPNISKPHAIKAVCTKVKRHGKGMKTANTTIRAVQELKYRYNFVKDGPMIGILNTKPLSVTTTQVNTGENHEPTTFISWSDRLDC